VSTPTPATSTFWIFWDPADNPTLTITPPTSVTNVAPIISLFLSGISANVVVTAASDGVFNGQTPSTGYVQVGTLEAPSVNVSLALGPSQGRYPTSLELYTSPYAAPMNVLVVCSKEVATSNVVAVTATAPITSSGGTSPNIALTTPLPIADGGTGTATPSLVAGTNVTVTGTWPNQTIAASAASGVSSVTATSPLASSGGTTPAISLTGIISVANGGTGTASPAIVAGTNVTVSGTFPAQTVNARIPVYSAGGTLAAATLHIVYGQITASGTSTTITLSGSAAFTSTTYFLIVTDVATAATAVVTAQATGSFTFTSTSSHTYQYFALGV